MNKELREKLISMSDTESKAWRDLTKNGNRYDSAPEEFGNLRIKNAEELYRMIKIHGWPSISLVNEDGEIAAFKIARNAINKPELMKEFLKYIKVAVLNGDAKKYHEVCLEDCILYYQNKPQNYGIFYDWDESGKLSVNVENHESANANRLKLGLETIEQELSNHEKSLLQKAGGRPKDIKAHLRQTHEWATRVGWLNA